MSVCMYVCVCLHHSGTAGPIWLNLFLLAPYWSGDGFRLKNFRIRDPVFPEIRKNPYFRVLFDRFGWNFWVILTLNQICFYTNNFWIGYPVYRIRNPVFPEKSGKIWQKSDLTVYHDVIYHFSCSYSSLALNVQFGGFFQFFWKIFQDKGKNHQIKVT